MKILNRLLQIGAYTLLAAIIVISCVCIAAILYGFLGTSICLILSHFGVVDFTLMNCAMFSLATFVFGVLTRGASH